MNEDFDKKENMSPFDYNAKYLFSPHSYKLS